ncbi:hypothetical protein [Candidatus Pantoea edessiphila]|uniref:hypothetical protein n=1 Tax=Candidatus Pantoea edessiphila TaxID=2044610 RepID=UPI0030D4BDC8
MNYEKTKITIHDKKPIELKILKGTLGQNIIDIRILNSKELLAFDPGFTSTVSCKSKITFINGDKGI